MITCKKCDRPIGYSSITVEFIYNNAEHTYRFDTEACFVLWVRETYLEGRNGSV